MEGKQAKETKAKIGSGILKRSKKKMPRSGVSLRRSKQSLNQSRLHEAKKETIGTIDLKRSADPEAIKKAGEVALSGAVSGAGPVDAPLSSPVSGSSDDSPSRRGRKPGEKFPGGYKRVKDRQGVKEKIKEEVSALPVKVVPRSSVYMCVDTLFNKILGAKSSYWQMSPEEVSMLADPLREILQEFFPAWEDDVWTHRIMSMGFVLTPRVMAFMSEKKGKVPNNGDDRDSRKKESAGSPEAVKPSGQPVMGEFIARSRPARSWQVKLAEVDPSKGTP